MNTPLLEPFQMLGREIGEGNIPVFDPVAGRETMLIPRPIQIKMYQVGAEQAARGEPVRVAGPKYRRAGVTTFWLTAAWSFCRRIKKFKAVVLAHTKEDVEEIFGIVLFLHEQSGLKSLKFNNKPICDETTRDITFPNGSKIVCRTLGSGAGLGRGSGFNMIHVTELAYLQRVNSLDAQAMTAILNTVEDAPNTIIIAEGTGAGPTGEFYRICDDADHNRGPFKLCFTPWFADPKHVRPKSKDDEPFTDAELRRQATFGLSDEQLLWYRHKRSQQPTEADMKREFPERLQDCFEVASGRVLFTFSDDQHVTNENNRPNIEKGGWDLYRSIDWGFSDINPFVCLWVAHMKAHSPRLLIDRECQPRMRKEMFAWARDPVTGKPLEKDDHGPDCLRYAIQTFRLTGLVYVYRALYIQPCTSPAEAARAVHEASGWVLPPGAKAAKLNLYRPGVHGESYKGTVADRAGGSAARPDTPIGLFNRWGIPVMGHKDPGHYGQKANAGGENKGVLEQSIDLLLSVLSGRADMYTKHTDKADALARRVHRARHPEGGQRPRRPFLTQEEQDAVNARRDPEWAHEIEYDPATEYAGT